MREAKYIPIDARTFRVENGEESHLPTLTADMLYEANTSPAAEKNLQEFYENWRNGKIVLLRRCSDSRIPVSTTTAVDNASMGAEGPKSPYTGLMLDAGIGAIANVTHFDGILSKPGERPVGCGALDAAESLKMHGLSDSLEDDHSGLFVSEIKSSDQSTDAFSNADAIAKHVGKPVLIGAIDHRRLELIPVAVIEKKGNSLSLILPESLPIGSMLQGRYDAAKIYKNGIPRLDEGQIPEEFIEWLEDTRRDYAELRRTYSDLLETQASQNPHTLFVTTEKITPRGRYPGLFDRPGSIFVVHVSGTKDLESGLKIPDASIKTALRQNHYATDHLKIESVIFETADIAESRRMADAFCNRRIFGN
ncbi:hypothetical protein KKG52_03390 [Patescibacteria group bacterium]|nr:hypothetical protein [Patescibacteria group bacterium]